MRQVTFDTYDRLIADRPFKLSPEEVNYRPADGAYRCDQCVHFYTRKVDGYAVCEVLRDAPDDDHEKPIEPRYVCDFFTADNDHYPYLDGEL